MEDAAASSKTGNISWMLQRDCWNGLPLNDPQKPSALHARGTLDIGRTDESKFDVEMPLGLEGEICDE